MTAAPSTAAARAALYPVLEHLAEASTGSRSEERFLDALRRAYEHPETLGIRAGALAEHWACFGSEDGPISPEWVGIAYTRHWYRWMEREGE